MDTLPPPPAGINLSESRKASIMVTAIVTWFLAAIVVGLRIISHRIKKISLWLDDWLIIAALLPSCAHVIGLGIYSVSRGLGKHIWADPPDAKYAWAIGLFVAELGYFVTITCVKWSILAFYWRSFKVRSSVKIPIYILAVIVLLWAIAVILVTIFQCQPTSAWWNRFNPTHPLRPDQYRCTVDSVKFFYGNAIPTIVTDVLMLALPLPYITKLQLPRGQKFALVGIFLVGIFVTVVSIVRLHYLVRGNLADPDITWSFVDIALWSVVEGNVAIFCACLPFLRPVLSKISFGFFSLSSLSSKKQQQSSGSLKMSHHNRDGPRPWQGDSRFATTSHSRAYSTANETDEHPFARLTDDGSERSVPIKERPDGSHIELGNISGVGEPVQPNGIVITREFHLQHQDV
ncbi:uncharacterized protein TRIVIDRAFT_221904 [Trichoderma virens Gv29-8]|uniref:Rhodopsin domain-containing protein n=1 Tax=Hypocrea virens (strain Gv29-8 / FGSC 10586) TaxID=413071 RepID=G9MRB0_HYPVG|nr:uncharacterized protein TRIVIDRAFT_221904 [Trichoderma virens Gv29-8]EHK22634.1 hypothetical protein TRIVIDRAFT_221904 [Trichoderma virens Gv29-8]UKZ47685.1 hypothetical protein TrVGV298_001911 [Trichoderma virens]